MKLDFRTYKYGSILLSTGIVGLLHGLFGINIFTGISVLFPIIVLYEFEKLEIR